MNARMSAEEERRSHSSQEERHARPLPRALPSLEADRCFSGIASACAFDACASAPLLLRTLASVLATSPPRRVRTEVEESAPVPLLRVHPTVERSLDR
jgi:hypothetical protein